MSSILAPASRFSKIADTGIRVPFKTHAPLTLPGTLSTAEHCDQSRVAMFSPSFIVTFSHAGDLAGLKSHGSFHVRPPGLRKQRERGGFAPAQEHSHQFHARP